MNTGDAASPFGTPAAEYTPEPELVASLLAEQHPDLAQLSFRLFESGWDNTMYRLGEQLLLRLPRRAAAASLVLNEQTWLPRLAPRLPLPIPSPLRIGTPGHGYPWHWSVLPWLSGTAADLHEPHASQARPLALFLRALHVRAPDDAPDNPWRGGPLATYAAVTQERMQRLAAQTDLITPAIEQIWNTALQAQLDVPVTWLHGDLHPRNVLVENGVLSGVIDWGDITSGDRATDLAAIWMLFGDSEARYAALEAYDCSEATLQRARGWAVRFGLMLLETGLADTPRHAVIGERTLRRVAQMP